jgi:hypothetical protein
MRVSFPIPHSPFPICLAAALCLASSPCRAQDTITLAPRPDDPGRIVLRGRVVDYTGGLLTYENSVGAQQSVPGKQVVSIESTWNADHTAGDAAWRRRDFLNAAAKYQAASASETRRWARRMIQARLVACLRELDRWDQAAELFLALAKDDPATPYFAAIPLPWTTITATPTLEAKAKTWSADRTTPLAALLGSSFLLATPERAEAIRRLRELSQSADARIAPLADAQLWRTAAVTADAATIDKWQQSLDKLPEPLRAGPYLVLGRAWSQQNQPERAALNLLRVPILFGDEQPRLAAEALWSAGQALEQLTQPEQAAGLYRELLRDFPQAATATAARDRLTALAPSASPAQPK